MGDGHSSIVWLATSIREPSKTIALKLMKDDYVNKIDNAIKEIVNEKQILKSLKHQHIISIGDGGIMGQIVNPNGSKINGRHFLELEYVSGGLLFDLC